MPRLLAALVLAAALLAPATAGATQYSGDGAEMAANAMTLRVPPVPGAVEIFRQSNPACPAPACAWPAMGQMWIQPGLRGRSLEERFVVLHELGHIFDYRALDNTERAQFARLFRTHPWADDQQQHMGGEMFADAYAACGLGLNLTREWIVDEYIPSSIRQHRKVCAVIRSSSVRNTSTAR